VIGKTTCPGCGQDIEEHTYYDDPGMFVEAYSACEKCKISYCYSYGYHEQVVGDREWRWAHNTNAKTKARIKFEIEAEIAKVVAT
jgi:hypothetical protein